MKRFLRSVFGFIITPLEKGDSEYKRNPLGRKIMIVIGVLFLALGIGVGTIALGAEELDIGNFFPSVIFSCAGIFCLVVGCLASDRAVAKVWGG